MRLATIAFLLILGLLAIVTPAQAADPIWLDNPLQRWNGPGAGIPAAPRPDTPFQRICLSRERGLQIEEEKQVVAAGWRLEDYWPAQRADDVAVVMATSYYDGMCRPWAYQAFAFVGGRFAGTLSPVLMNSRFDGMMDGLPMVRPGGIIEAVFTRYAAIDPLCCPSLPKVRVRYELLKSPSGLVYIPTVATALPLPGSPPAQLPSTGDSLPMPAVLVAAGLLLLAAGTRMWLVSRA